MELSYHLSEFVRVFNIMGNLSPQDMLVMYTAVLVAQHCVKKTPVEEFQAIVNRQNLQEKVTGASIIDFPHTEADDLVKVVKKYGGVWETKLGSSGDSEDNAFYAAFINPMKAYSFMMEAMY